MLPLGGLQAAPRAGKDYTPFVEGQRVRQKIERANDYKQAGERYRAFEEWDRDDLILNLVNTLKPVAGHIQERMIRHFTRRDPDYGRCVAEGRGINVQANGAVSGFGSADNRHGSTIGADAAASDAAAHSAEEQGHPARPIKIDQYKRRTRGRCHPPYVYKHQSQPFALIDSSLSLNFLCSSVFPRDKTASGRTSLDSPCYTTDACSCT